MPDITLLRARTRTKRRQWPGGLPSLLGIIGDGRSESLQVFIAQFLLDMEFGGFIRVVHGGLLCWKGLTTLVRSHRLKRRKAMPVEKAARVAHKGEEFDAT